MQTGDALLKKKNGRNKWRNLTNANACVQCSGHGWVGVTACFDEDVNHMPRPSRSTDLEQTPFEMTC